MNRHYIAQFIKDITQMILGRLNVVPVKVGSNYR